MTNLRDEVLDFLSNMKVDKKTRCQECGTPRQYVGYLCSQCGYVVKE